MTGITYQTRQEKANTANVTKSSEGKSYPSRTIVHAKLEMTEPGDLDEQEADSVANTIASGGKISRKISNGGSSSGITVSQQMENQLSRLQGGGHTMPSGLRHMMESGFGQDFSHVRLHTDSQAADMSSSISAKAFTHGNDIYFNRGQFSPNTTEGQRLVAHELTHVVQGSGKVSRNNSCKEDSIEEANKQNVNLEDKAIALIAEIRSSFNSAMNLIIQEKFIKPDIPMDFIYDMVGDALSFIPKVGQYLSLIPKYIKDGVDISNATSSYNNYTIFSDIQKTYLNYLDDLKQKVFYPPKSEDDTLKNIVIELRTFSCENNVNTIKNKITKSYNLYKEYIYPIGAQSFECYDGDVSLCRLESEILLAEINNELYLIDVPIYYGSPHVYKYLVDVPDFIVEKAKKKQLPSKDYRFTFSAKANKPFEEKLCEYKGEKYNKDLIVMDKKYLLNDEQKKSIRRRYRIIRSCKPQKECERRIELDDFNSICNELKITEDQKKHIQQVLQIINK